MTSIRAAPAFRAGGGQPVGQDGQGGVVERGRGFERQQVGQGQVVLPPAERLDAEPGTVELGKGHGVHFQVARAPRKCISFIPHTPPETNRAL